MKLDLKISEDFSGDTTHELTILDSNGEEIDAISIRSLWENPEDAVIGRDLLDGDDIIDLMTLAYAAGRRGEKLETSRIVITEDETELRFMDEKPVDWYD